MTSQEIKKQLEPLLTNYVIELKKIENLLTDEILYYKDNHPDWLKNNDFRLGSFSRILSAIIASKFTATKTLDYLNSEKWENDFRDKYIPEPWKEADYFGHFKDIAMLIRFYAFHSIYSQVETTNRIIMREKNLRTNSKPGYIVNEITKTYDEGFIKFIDFIRNAIHTNGYHFPKNANNNKWEYNFKGNDFYFEIGEPIELDFDNIINIMNEMIDALVNTLRHEEIVKIKIVPDLT